MKPALIILTHKGADAVFKMNHIASSSGGMCRSIIGSTSQRSLPAYKSNADWAFVDIEPAEVTACFGKEPFDNQREHIDRLISVMEWAHRYDSDYSHYFLAEYDCVFLRDIRHGDILDDTISCLRRTADNYHPPWCIPKNLMEPMIDHAKRMLSANVIEDGHLGRFMWLLTHLFSVPVFFMKGYCHVRIGEDPQSLEEARNAVSKGAWVVHGVRDQSTLELLRANFKDVCTS